MLILLYKDIAFAESRIRIETIAAEDILQDLGAISIVSSDSQAMGRVGEVITRTWQTAGYNHNQMNVLLHIIHPNVFAFNLNLSMIGSFFPPHYMV